MTQRSEMPEANDDWKKSPGKKKKVFPLEYRIRPEKIGHRFFIWGSLKDWAFYKRYRTEAEREKAMNTLNRKDTLFEYRIPEEKKEPR